MVNGTRRADHIKMAKDSLAATCGHCGKTLQYPYKQPVTLSMWSKILQTFFDKHNKCLSPL